MLSGSEKQPVVVDFTLAGTPYRILNGGPHYVLNPAVSIAVSTVDQRETDSLWEALLADGGEAGRCGWLTDRFGVSWQIIPHVLPELLSSNDRVASARARDAMMQMQKLDIERLERAFRGA